MSEAVQGSSLKWPLQVCQLALFLCCFNQQSELLRPLTCARDALVKNNAQATALHYSNPQFVYHRFRRYQSPVTELWPLKLPFNRSVWEHTRWSRDKEVGEAWVNVNLESSNYMGHCLIGVGRFQWEYYGRAEGAETVGSRKQVEWERGLCAVAYLL